MYDTTMLPILVRSCETTELTVIHKVFSKASAWRSW